MNSFPVHVLWAVVVLLAAAALPVVCGVWLDLPSTGAKCVYEDLRHSDVVVGDYYAFIGDQEDENSPVFPTISVTVTSPNGDDLHRQENVTHGQFAFTTSDSGTYSACFWEHGDHHGGKTVTVGIDWKTGVAAKDWDAIAKKENLEVIEVELMKVEAAVKLIHGNLISLKEREATLRNMSEATNVRVACCSMVSLGVCIVVSVFQVWYLRRFFKKNKLI
ncbi:transmembrane emp24 domain-containing protein p24delta3-like [Primulina huaijiensis]|uniref:transmembrane emp24 domain-containing protein p24delta3-like n=1 Tax=Primulina huaijiensis TaxID=1492673 RepID=UPI003CC717E1